MPFDLTALTALFSGGQLAVVVFVVLELRSAKEGAREMKLQYAAVTKQLNHVDKRLAHVMGRLKIADVEMED